MSQATYDVAVIGGGPAGIFAARQIKLRHPQWRVRLFERNARDAIYGFGVSLGGQVLSVVKSVDPQLHDALLAQGHLRDSTQRLEVDGERVDWAWGGWKSLSISRALLLAALQDLAVEAGVEMTYGVKVGTADLPDVDLIIAADGANSTVRREHEAAFGPYPRDGEIKAIWLGARGDHHIEGSIFVIREDESGPWALHAYPHGDGLATLVIEADAATLARAGIGQEDFGAVAAPGSSDLASRDYLARLFADHVGDAELMISNSRWFTFSMVRNRWWSAGRVVLIGDAGHTAHFSIGSGTRLAFEDGIALADALDAEDSVVAALATYERNRRPDVEKLQAAALPSQRWWEAFGSRTHLPVSQVAASYISRTGLYPVSRFARRDPAFVAALRSDFVTRNGGTGTPLEAPLSVDGLELPSRVLARGSAGPSVTPAEVEADVDAVVEAAGRIVVLEVAAAELGAAEAAVRKLAAPAGAADKPVAVTIVDPPLDIDGPGLPALEAGVRALAEAGARTVVLRPTAGEASQLEILELAECVRIASGLPVGVSADLDEEAVETALLAGRIDFVVSTAASASAVVHAAPIASAKGD